MNIEYINFPIKNVFEHLDDKSSLCLLGLCLAVNDITHCHEQMQKETDTHHTGENTYLFAIILSVLREVAKVIDASEETELWLRCSLHTSKLFAELKTDLLPFDDQSLTGGTLKPVRNMTFHYDFSKSKKKELWNARIKELKNEETLSVRRPKKKDDKIFSTRYKFADEVREKLINRFLTEKDAILEKLTKVVLSFAETTDSLLQDLSTPEDRSFTSASG